MMNDEKFYTDYPFEYLGDIAGEEAPIREVKIKSYDGNKYVEIEIEGFIDKIKSGYIYKNANKKPISAKELNGLCRTIL